MIIIGRKSKFGGTETLSYYKMADREVLRILRRCSKIDTLLLNVPVLVESDFPTETRSLIRAYVGDTQIRLVKIASLFDIHADVQ